MKYSIYVFLGFVFVVSILCYLCIIFDEKDK